jgi:hypothetical protein
MGYFFGYSNLDYFKMKEGVELGLTHSKSYKDNNKWQNIMHLHYFNGKYSYLYKPQNSQKTFFREVNAHNFLFDIGKEYGFLLLNKRTKKLYTGPSLSLNILGYYEQGSSREINEGVPDLNFSDFSVEIGISSSFFLEYEYIPYQNGYFIRLEGGYLFNPVNDFVSYGGFPGGWKLTMSVGYRINNY